jgi:hypothetical protein
MELDPPSLTPNTAVVVAEPIATQATTKSPEATFMVPVAVIVVDVVKSDEFSSYSLKVCAEADITSRRKIKDRITSPSES